MVTKSKVAGAKKKGKVKVLKLNKETVKNLTVQERKKIKGGLILGTGDTCKCVRNAINPDSLLCR